MTEQSVKPLTQTRDRIMNSSLQPSASAPLTASSASPAWTPGPWGSAPTGSTMRGYSQPLAIYQDGKDNLIAGCFGDVVGGDAVAIANARLIAAAPELYEALEWARLFVEADPASVHALKAVDAALRKATTG